MKVPLPRWDAREVVNDTVSVSTIMWIAVAAVSVLAMIWAAYGFGKSQAVPLPRVVSFSGSQRDTALALTRISAETGAPYQQVFDLYVQNLSNVRTFDQQWNVSFAMFHKLWNLGCFDISDPVPCDTEGPIIGSGDTAVANGATE